MRSETEIGVVSRGGLDQRGHIEYSIGDNNIGRGHYISDSEG